MAALLILYTIVTYFLLCRVYYNAGKDHFQWWRIDQQCRTMTHHREPNFGVSCLTLSHLSCRGTQAMLLLLVLCVVCSSFHSFKVFVK